MILKFSFINSKTNTHKAMRRKVTAEAEVSGGRERGEERDIRHISDIYFIPVVYKEVKFVWNVKICRYPKVRNLYAREMK